MSPAALPLRHALLALAVVFVWGTNFAVIRVALGHLPPLLFATLRFTFALLPAVFVLKKPDVRWRNLAAYGVLIGAGQFGLLYIAMKGSISPGLASLVIQTQVVFTIALSMWAGGERLARMQWLALGLAAAGIGVIVWRSGADARPVGVALTLAAAFSWACGNIVAKRSPGVNMLAYVVWASLFAVPPLLAVSLILEGWPAMVEGVRRADATTWAAVLWQSVGNTMFGYAAWGWLLSRHPTAVIAPMALLVPVFGMAASALLFGEALPAWKLTAAGLVLSGLALNLLGPQVRRLLVRPAG